MPDLVAFMMWLGADVHEAENVAQEAMLRAYKGWETIEHPRAWVRTVASREHFRRRLACHEDPTPEVRNIPQSDADAAVISQEQARVLALLGRLPLRQRQIMAWVYDGYTPKEIAGILGMEPNAARASLHKAREALKAYLAQEGGQS
jgi:RNA polymerase sigma-70 factor (ECF subfamily)